MWFGVFSVVCILLPIKYKLLKALNFYSSAKLRKTKASRCLEYNEQEKWKKAI
jgi:hypothetical protein